MKPLNVVDSSGWLEYFIGSPRAQIFAPALEDLPNLVALKTTTQMKPLSPFRLLLGLALMVGTSLEAETVFEANFDESPPYQEGARLPTGKWSSSPVVGLPIVVSGEESLSSPWSLLLENTGESVETGRPAWDWKAAAWTRVDMENALGVQTAKTITCSCAFTISRVDGNETEFAAVGIPSTGGNVPFVVRIGVGGTVMVWKHRADPEVLGTIEPGKWYELEIITPNSEGSEAHPVINLYSVKDAERGERIGSSDGLALPPDARRGNLTLFNNLPNSKIFFDNILVTLDD